MTWRKREILDEIHSCSYYCNRPECIKAQRDDLRDKLAQPEQEPVAWVEYEIGNHTKRPQNCGTGYCSCIECVMELPQREWVGLTDEEIQQVFVSNSVMVDNGNAYMVAGLRAVNIGQAIEAKLRSKNT